MLDPTPKPHLVVIGNGMAGCRAVEEILERDADKFRITIFGAEPRVNYNRIMLSPLLAGEKSFEDIIINGHDWYAAHGIDLVAGDPVASIDRAAKTVTGKSGRVETYDKLLIATGSDPFIIPVPGKDLPGVITFRDMDDVGAMLEAANRAEKNPQLSDAVVIGGGLLGLEAAHGLSLRGMKVTVIHLMPTLMERQLDEAAGWLLKDALEGRGQTILTGADTAQIYGTGKVEGVRLKDGREIPASIVVMAVGIRPNTVLAKDAGLATGRGIHVDDHMVTSDADVLAVGECVEHDGNVPQPCRRADQGTQRLSRLGHLNQAQGLRDRRLFSRRFLGRRRLRRYRPARCDTRRLQACHRQGRPRHWRGALRRYW
jgi:nitrite reductase (NADH) large subunit